MSSLSSFAHPSTCILQQKRDSNTNRDSYARSHPGADQLPVGASTRAVEDRTCSLLRSCVSFPRLTQIHARIVRHAIYSSNLVAAKLVSACFSLDRPDRVFAHVPRPSPFLWNSMIKGYVGLGRHRDALLVYRRMLDCGCRLDNCSFTSALKACSNLLALEEGMALHGHVLKLGLGADIYIATSLMDLSGMCSQALDARKVFDHMPDKVVVAWNVMLHSYARLGMMRLAEQLFEEIPLRNVNSWTALICGFLECGDLSESIVAFHRMQLYGLKPDKVMVVTMLSAIADLGMLDSGPC
ncbi:PPR repeat [Musa troglodytarum]|uniref:PPR repeat n=1 Tax=Musa troglodytarum TaxID=320322 RepID=A0A9E7GAL7_9LILI|nr:PPR repeat [Musa troglodytarum]URE11699.1 PPR repeat [Musa troglodytarum]